MAKIVLLGARGCIRLPLASAKSLTSISLSCEEAARFSLSHAITIQLVTVAAHF